MAWGLNHLMTVLQFYRQRARGGFFASKADRLEYTQKAKVLAELIREIEPLNAEQQAIAMRWLAMGSSDVR